MNQQDDTTTAEIEAFKDDPMEVVRCVAAVAAQFATMTPEEVARQPFPLSYSLPLAQAAKAMCVARGYAEDGNELPGFMERAARAELDKPIFDYEQMYNTLLSRAKDAGFQSISDAVAYAAKAKFGLNE